LLHCFSLRGSVVFATSHPEDFVPANLPRPVRRLPTGPPNVTHWGQAARDRLSRSKDSNLSFGRTWPAFTFSWQRGCGAGDGFARQDAQFMEVRTDTPSPDGAPRRSALAPARIQFLVGHLCRTDCQSVRKELPWRHKSSGAFGPRAPDGLTIRPTPGTTDLHGRGLVAHQSKSNSLGNVAAGRDRAGGRTAGGRG